MEPPPLKFCGLSYGGPQTIFRLLPPPASEHRTAPEDSSLPVLHPDPNFQYLLIVSPHCSHGAVVTAEPIDGIDLQYEQRAHDGGLLIIGFTILRPATIRSWVGGHFIGERRFA